MQRDDAKQYPEYLVRAEARRYSVIIDADADRFGVSGPGLELFYFNILRLTPCGAWIDVWGEARFVLLTANKKWACKTTDEALGSLAARKRRQVQILSRRLQEAKEDLALAEEATQPGSGMPAWGGGR
jgi:hypothetical protein